MRVIYRRLHDGRRYHGVEAESHVRAGSRKNHPPAIQYRKVRNAAEGGAARYWLVLLYFFNVKQIIFSLMKTFNV